MRWNWPFFKDSDWLILVFVHSAKPTAELENLAMSLSLSSPGLSYDTKFVHIGWELRSSLVGDTILGVQSEPACRHTFDALFSSLLCTSRSPCPVSDPIRFSVLSRSHHILCFFVVVGYVVCRFTAVVVFCAAPTYARRLDL